MERRHYPRSKAQFNVRFLVNSDNQGDGVSIDVSGSGVAIASDEEVTIGDHIVAYFDGGTRLEGIVMRKFDEGFAVELKITNHRRRRLLEFLSTHNEEDEADDGMKLERRISHRLDCGQIEASCRTDTGTVPCNIMDMSLTGASIKTPLELRIGETVVLGATPGKVVRRSGNQYGIRFDRPTLPRMAIDEETLDDRHGRVLEDHEEEGALPPAAQLKSASGNS
ncbi:MAG: PilZ domain-containing protein [Pseudomonadota bacterium]